jgi:hypothetical protein
MYVPDMDFLASRYFVREELEEDEKMTELYGSDTFVPAEELSSDEEEEEQLVKKLKDEGHDPDTYEEETPTEEDEVETHIDLWSTDEDAEFQPSSNDDDDDDDEEEEEEEEEEEVEDEVEIDVVKCEKCENDCDGLDCGECCACKDECLCGEDEVFTSEWNKDEDDE